MRDLARGPSAIEGLTFESFRTPHTAALHSKIWPLLWIAPFFPGNLLIAVLAFILPANRQTSFVGVHGLTI